MARDNIAQWRQGILSAVVWALAVLSSIAYVTGVGAAIGSGDISIIAFNTAVFAAIWALALRRWPYRIRTWGLLLLSNAIGLHFTYRFGPFAAGPAWLLATPILAGLLLGRRVALGHVAALAAALAALTVLHAGGLVSWSDGIELGAWIAMCGSLIALGAILALAVSVLLDGLASANRDLEKEIEQRERTEELLVQAQKMEAIGRLAGGIAHDFNNLLTANLAFTTFAQESLDEDHPAYQDLGESLESIHRAQKLTSELLAFSRQQRVEPRVIDPCQVVAGLKQTLRRILREDIELIARLPVDTWNVELDPTALERVLMNLASNAQDAMSDGGRMVIEIANQEIDGDFAPGNGHSMPSGDYVMIAVSDTGVGMDEEVLASIFEPFFTTKEIGRGTGLGLASCYGIVKQAGGYIWADSEPASGSTFKLYFPRSRDETASVDEPELPGDLSGTESVLVVEDNADVRAITVRTLRRSGYQVHHAADGLEALEIVAGLEPQPPQLVISDVVMPRMRGPELVARLREQHPDIRVLYLSGYTRESVNRGSALEAERLLPKPFTADDLLRAARLALDR